MLSLLLQPARHTGNNGGRKRLPAGGTWKGPKAGEAASGSFVEGGTLAKSRTSGRPGSVLFLAPKCIKNAIFSNNTTTTARGRNADLGLARSSVGRALSVLCSGSCLEPTSLRLYFCVILVRHGAYIRYVRLYACYTRGRCACAEMQLQLGGRAAAGGHGGPIADI